MSDEYNLFQGLLSIIMLICSDVYVLITYSSIVESFFIMLTVSAILHFRRTRPNMERPIKVLQLLNFELLLMTFAFIYFFSMIS